MYKKNNRTCVICHKVYTYCPSCVEFLRHPRWMVMFDEKNCMDVYYVTSDYSAGLITKDEAAEKIMELDLSNVENFQQSVKDVVLELMTHYKEMNNVEVKKAPAEENGPKQEIENFESNPKKITFGKKMDSKNK